MECLFLWGMKSSILIITWYSNLIQTCPLHPWLVHLIWSQKSSNCVLLIYAPHWTTGLWDNCTPCKTGWEKTGYLCKHLGQSQQQWATGLNWPPAITSKEKLKLLKTLRKYYRKPILFLHKFFLRLCKCSLSGIFIDVRCKLICTSMRWNNMQSEHTLERNTVIIPLLFHKTSGCIIKIIF